MLPMLGCHTKNDIFLYTYVLFLTYMFTGASGPDAEQHSFGLFRGRRGQQPQGCRLQHGHERAQRSGHLQRRKPTVPRPGDTVGQAPRHGEHMLVIFSAGGARNGGMGGGALWVLACCVSFLPLWVDKGGVGGSILR